MHETDAPYGTGPGTQRPYVPRDATATSGAESSGAESGGVKERVADTASHLGDAGRETAQDAKEKAHDVVHEASERARGLIGRTRIELKAQAETQQQRLAGGLRSLGDEMGQMADGSQEPGYATTLIRHAGDATTQAAQWFEDREPDTIWREVEDFARRRPGMFIAMAAGAGLLVGRFLRSMKDAPDDGETAQRAGAQPSSPPQAYRPAAAPAAPAAPATFPPPTPGGAGPRTAGGDPYVERT